MLKKIASIALALMLSLSVFVGCSDGDNDSSNSSVASTVDDSSITETSITIDGTGEPTEVYKYFFLYLKAQSDNGDDSYWTGKDDEFSELIKSAEEFTSNYFVPQKIAKQYNITLDDDDIKNLNDTMASEMEQYGGEDAFNEMLAQQSVTKEFYTNYMTNYALESKVFETLYADGGPKAVGDDVVLDTVKDDYVAVKHILIKTPTETDSSVESSDSSSSSEAETDPLALAESVLKEAKAGENFDDLVKKYSEDSMPEIGYFFTHGQMVQVFDDASFALKDNEVSDLVESDYGYHIIKKIPISEYFKNSPDEVKQACNGLLYDTLLKNYASSIKIDYSKEYENLSVDSFK